MATHRELYGSCACERNQYTITLPSDSGASNAQVYLDNSAANRRSQAAPITAWLKIPLDWYHSSTYAQFPDETHASIKKVFHSAPAIGGLRDGVLATRKQFCGYCGTHLTAWSEREAEGGGEWLEVTLGSLEAGSLGVLEGLGVLGGLGSSEEEKDEEEEEDDWNEEVGKVVRTPGVGAATRSADRLRGRGMPWFEEMVEDGRFGRVKRQKGGQSSRDGSNRVEWQVVELEGADEDESMAEAEVDEVGESGLRNKRLKIDG
ncbi:hypothetical protein MBLNU230_g7732t1 [Neophaeotheca triangularis]